VTSAEVKWSFSYTPSYTFVLLYLDTEATTFSAKSQVKLLVGVLCYHKCCLLTYFLVKTFGFAVVSNWPYTFKTLALNVTDTFTFQPFYSLGKEALVIG